jgi:hypothetical protein
MLGTTPPDGDSRAIASRAWEGRRTATARTGNDVAPSPGNHCSAHHGLPPGQEYASWRRASGRCLAIFPLPASLFLGRHRCRRRRRGPRCRTVRTEPVTSLWTSRQIPEKPMPALVMIEDVVPLCRSVARPVGAGRCARNNFMFGHPRHPPSCALTGGYGSVPEVDLGLGTLVPTRQSRGGGTIRNGTDRRQKEVGHLARRALGKRLSGVGQGDGFESSLRD